ncbi:MAG: hypothetical protein ACE368_04985 [Paracoccaceae bacterium]
MNRIAAPVQQEDGRLHALQHVRDIEMVDHVAQPSGPVRGRRGKLHLDEMLDLIAGAVRQVDLGEELQERGVGLPPAGAHEFQMRLWPPAARSLFRGDSGPGHIRRKAPGG